jgi:hypothetical protein
MLKSYVTLLIFCVAKILFRLLLCLLREGMLLMFSFYLF